MTVPSNRPGRRAVVFNKDLPPERSQKTPRVINCVTAIICQIKNIGFDGVTSVGKSLPNSAFDVLPTTLASTDDKVVCGYSHQLLLIIIETIDTNPK